ncbi:hypothetical protein HPG69_006311 [Diceros bicornis minor]|uniref:AB hydrolase-1 domain-containing protein n=1 Tax=Diceros bicornis minor TaxID=77932 RepID=A0A7J7FNH8_DICBM|nr:hypothetical protein HPG69_006311 [Diceros bicornis minor]
MSLSLILPHLGGSPMSPVYTFICSRVQQILRLVRARRCRGPQDCMTTRWTQPGLPSGRETIKQSHPFSRPVRAREHPEGARLLWLLPGPSPAAAPARGSVAMGTAQGSASGRVSSRDPGVDRDLGGCWSPPWDSPGALLTASAGGRGGFPSAGAPPGRHRGPGRAALELQAAARSPAGTAGRRGAGPGRGRPARGAAWAERRGRPRRQTDSGGLFSELKLAVPWGHIAAKAWGPQQGHPVLCLHGWLDNANSFDQLIPLLPKDFHYIAMDFGGHGLSSHYSPGLPYYHQNFVSEIRRVVAGGTVGGMFSCIFPEMVDKLILLDSSPFALDSNEMENMLIYKRRAIEHTLQVEASKKPSSVVSPEEMLRGFLKNNSHVSEECGKLLLQRGTTRVATGKGLTIQGHC